MKQQPSHRLRAIGGVVHVVDDDGHGVIATLSIDKARAARDRGEIVAAAKPGFAKVTDLPVTDATEEEISAIKRRIALKKEREKAERARRRNRR